MPQYISNNGYKEVQLDDGDKVPVNVTLSLEGGVLTKLPDAQITSLRNPVLPSDFPLPAAQVADLKNVSVANFPAQFTIGNFPSSFNVGNLPATFPLPTNQENLVVAIRDAVVGYTKGAGGVNANTLRVSIGRETPTSVSRSNVASSTTAQLLVAAATGRKLLTIYNDSTAILYLGIGSTVPTSTNFTYKLFPDDYYSAPLHEVELEFRGVWASANGAARITLGV